MNISDKIKQYEELNDSIHDYIFPRLCELFVLKTLNNGNLPNRKPEDCISITDFFTTNDNDVAILYSIHWGGDVYDNDSIKLSVLEVKPKD